MKAKAQFKCLHCREFSVPDYRHRDRQHYCSKPECRQASKSKSQRRWNAKTENQNYFRGPDNTRRVQEWRQRHPDYWRNKKPADASALQETCPAQPAEPKEAAPPSPPGALQDVCFDATRCLRGTYLHDDRRNVTRGHRQERPLLLGSRPRHPGHPTRSRVLPEP
jgi:hypothetical protein